MYVCVCMCVCVDNKDETTEDLFPMIVIEEGEIEGGKERERRG